MPAAGFTGNNRIFAECRREQNTGWPPGGIGFSPSSGKEAQLRGAAFLGQRREYIRNQEREDNRLDQMNLWR
jgi:hypothetical protein